MINQIKAVFVKEFKDSFRDYRALIAVFAFALLSPAMMAGVFWMKSKNAENAEIPTISVVGGHYAPGLMIFLENQGFALEQANDQANEQKGNIGIPEIPDHVGALLVLDYKFSKNFNEKKPATIHVYVNMEKEQSRMASRIISRAIMAYGDIVARNRLISHGVAPFVARPYALDVSDISEKGALAKIAASMFLMLFLVAPFYGGMSIALDTMAGERERDSLQPLLALPMHNSSLVIGKWLMTSLLGFLSTFTVTVCYAIVLSFVPLSSLGIRLDVGIVSVLMILSSLAPMILMVASLQLFISLMAKNFKEGQMYMGMLVLVPMVFLGYYLITEDNTRAYLDYLPIFGDLNVVSTILTGGVINMPQSFIVMSLNILVTAIILTLTARRLGSEKLLDEA